MFKTLTLILVFLYSCNLWGQTQHAVKPSNTGANIDTPDFNHYAYINDTINKKNRLFLFLPGTGGRPYHYRKLLKSTANLGYHSIGLTYPNDKAINIVCAFSQDTTCHSRARKEIFDGIDRHSNYSVDSNNCIQNRIIKILQHLDSNFPNEEWGQYFLNDSIYWHKIILSGHSQGGGHAAIIGKLRKLKRVVMFASLDWMPMLNRNPDWVFWNSLTPPDRYYCFGHENDELVDFLDLQTTWSNLNLYDYGALVMVDSLSSPYTESRTLSTLVTPANNASKFHNSVAVDLYTPMSGSTPVLEPVWHYLIDYQEPIKFVSIQGDWDQAINWNLARVPDFEDHVIIPDTSSVTIINGTDAECNSIEVLIGGVLECELGATLNARSEN